MGSAAFRLSAGTKRFPNAPGAVFEALDLELGRGELLVLLGASGSGKSTLLRCIAGLDPLTSGELSFDAGAGARATLVFQEPRLMPWLTLRENVALGLRYARNRAAAAAVDVDVLLGELGLVELADRLPGALSGGQAQRASLARAVAIHPAVLLLDEPFSALDPATRSEMQDWLLALRARHDLAILMVTHDVNEALRLGDRVVLLAAGGGVLRSWTQKELGAMPRSEIIAEYRRAVAARPARLEGVEA
ncbi:MAG TPA: ATP-binding cassette domain-containing protein [Polyangiaceae bacterium]|nr:ATP-binding cassette domain-containing protein [Polyangiaceae bacterium]